MQRLGYCAHCQSTRVGWLYNAIDPETGRLVAVCSACEYAWAQQRRPIEPAATTDDTAWRRLP